ncbi:unnamed protein product, partial [Amoebophrya sp. A120]
RNDNDSRNFYDEDDLASSSYNGSNAPRIGATTNTSGLRRPNNMMHQERHSFQDQEPLSQAHQRSKYRNYILDGEDMEERNLSFQQEQHQNMQAQHDEPHQVVHDKNSSRSATSRETTKRQHELALCTKMQEEMEMRIRLDEQERTTTRVGGNNYMDNSSRSAGNYPPPSGSTSGAILDPRADADNNYEYEDSLDREMRDRDERVRRMEMERRQKELRAQMQRDLRDRESGRIDYTVSAREREQLMMMH